MKPIEISQESKASLESNQGGFGHISCVENARILKGDFAHGKAFAVTFDDARWSELAARVNMLQETCVGAPWVFRGRSPRGFDCFGLLQYAVFCLTRKYLPEQSYEVDWYEKGFDYFNERWRDLFEPVSCVPIGGALFFRMGRKVVNHVAVYIGRGRLLHTTQKTGCVVSAFRGCARFLCFAGIPR